MVNLSLKSVQVDKFPDGTLRRQIVAHGGRAALIDKGLLPADNLNIAVAVEVAPWGTDFGAFKVAANGPKKLVAIKESQLFPEGDSSTTIGIELAPRDVQFRDNSFITDWVEGHTDIKRGKATVDPPDKKAGLVDNDLRHWSYRVLVVALDNSSVQMVVQAVPLNLGQVMSSPWATSVYMGGVMVAKFPAKWHPVLSPACRHEGPAPYLVDRRSGAVVEEGTMPTSQSYRNTVVDLLSLALCPGEVSVDVISDSNSTHCDPTVPVLHRFTELDPQSGGSGVKRPRSHLENDADGEETIQKQTASPAGE